MDPSRDPRLWPEAEEGGWCDVVCGACAVLECTPIVLIRSSLAVAAMPCSCAGYSEFVVSFPRAVEADEFLHVGEGRKGGTGACTLLPSLLWLGRLRNVVATISLGSTFVAPAPTDSACLLVT